MLSAKSMGSITPRKVFASRLCLVPLVDTTNPFRKESTLWGNRAGERFISWMDFSSFRIMVAKVPENKLWTVASLLWDDATLLIDDIRTPPDNMDHSPPPPSTKGRGIFGVVLYEAISFALANDLLAISLEGKNDALDRYYSSYGFTDSLGIFDYSLVLFVDRFREPNRSFRSSNGLDNSPSL